MFDIGILTTISAGKGALIGDLLHLVLVGAKAVRLGDATFWMWTAIIVGSLLALWLAVRLMRRA